MYKTCVSRWGVYLPAVVVILSLTSCFSGKKAQKELNYLQGKLDTLPNKTVALKEVTIQKGDLLSIIIFSDNPEATAIYNQQQAAVSSSGAGNSNVLSTTPLITNGYLVDQQGNIFMQSLGSIHAEGLTRQQLSDLLAEKLKPFLKNPYANIRFLNFRFTVIGEVNKPGTFTVPDEKVSVLEMLGMAGDLTVYGRRDNILVIREKNGNREFGRIDLRKSDVFQSPYFYLQQNDVVMVEANSKKASLNDQTTLRNLSIVTGFASLVSVAAIIYNIFR